MPRANIDLSWLASLLTKTPTADNSVNPAFQATETDIQNQGPTKDGSLLPDSHLYYGPTGKYVDPNSVNKYGVSTPYIPPSNWQRAVHPEESSAIDNLNNQFSSRPIVAQQIQDVTNKLGGQNFDTIRPTLPAPMRGLSSTQGFLTTGGDYQPVHVGAESRALVTNQAGTPTTLANTDVVNAGTGLRQAQGVAVRTRVNEEILDQDAVNRLSQLTHVEAPQINLTAQRLQGDLQRQPTYEEVREDLLSQQKQEAELGLKTAGTRNTLFDTYGSSTMHNQAVKDLLDSQRYSLQAPFENRINPSGTVTPVTRDPLGMSESALKMKTLLELDSNNKPNVVTLPSGKKGIGQPSSSTDIDPLIGQSINQPAPSGGSGAPTVTLSGGAGRPVMSTPSKMSMPDVESQLLNMGVIKKEELYTGKNRDMRHITPEQELELIKQRIPQLQQLISKQRNPYSYNNLLNSVQ